jgi:hypothetical protein
MNYFNLLLLLSGVLSVNSLYPAAAGSLDKAVAVIPEEKRTITLIFPDKANPEGKRVELEKSLWELSTVLKQAIEDDKAAKEISFDTDNYLVKLGVDPEDIKSLILNTSRGTLLSFLKEKFNQGFINILTMFKISNFLDLQTVLPERESLKSPGLFPFSKEYPSITSDASSRFKRVRNTTEAIANFIAQKTRIASSSKNFTLEYPETVYMAALELELDNKDLMNLLREKALMTPDELVALALRVKLVQDTKKWQMKKEPEASASGAAARD